MAYRREIILMLAAKYQSDRCNRHDGPIDGSSRSIVRSHDSRAARCFISGRITRIKITDYAVSSNGSAKKKFLEILFGAREIFRCIRFAFHRPPNRDTELCVFHGWLIAEFLQRPLKYDAIKSKMKLRHYELYVYGVVIFYNRPRSQKRHYIHSFIFTEKEKVTRRCMW